LHVTAVAIIPARYASTRFPGKPLAKATGKYLIQHVYERVMQARRISRTIIATDDDRIATAVREFGGEVAMTRDDHPSGTDRVAEVAAGLDAEIIVNVQGDEPEIEPAAIDLLVEKIESSPEAAMATLACPFPDDALVSDSSAVKVVVDTHGMALYFSRSVIPYPRDAGGAVKSPSDWLLHLGIYAYRRAFLLKLASLPPSRLEQVEKLEQLRALENGYRIVVGLVQRASVGIDTPTDYQAFVYRVSTDRNQGVAR
jgi:3-deoxy-manno-octulosonate cytidylyltransferase (CMP-KDO synthetase)